MVREVRHVVVSYDVHDPKRLLKVAKIMKDYGERVLRSVFECNLTDDLFRRMHERVDGVIDHMEDSVRFYFLCGKCVDRVEFSGAGSSFVEEEEVVIA